MSLTNALLSALVVIELVWLAVVAASIPAQREEARRQVEKERA